MKYLIIESILIYDDAIDILADKITTNDLSETRKNMIQKYGCKTICFTFNEFSNPEIQIDIDKIISDKLNVPIFRMKSGDRSKKREEVVARQIAMWWRKNNTKQSLSEIGKIYGGRDHATVLHSKKTIDDLISIDKKFRQMIDEIISLVELEKG